MYVDDPWCMAGQNVVQILYTFSAGLGYTRMIPRKGMMAAGFLQQIPASALSTPQCVTGQLGPRDAHVNVVT